MTTENGDQQIEKVSFDPKELMQLGHELIRTNRETQKEAHDLQLRGVELQEGHLEANKMAFRYRYFLVFMLLGVMFAIAAGLIFLKDDTDTGIKLVSYIGVAVMSFIGGVGWKSSQKSP